MKKSSEIHPSPTKFEVPVSIFTINNENLATIEEISGLSNYETVSVRVKILTEEDAVEVKKGLTKQDYWIADATGCCKIVTWEDNVGLLSVGDCFKLSGLMVRTYNGKKYLSVPKQGFQVSQIDDIGVVEGIPAETETEKKLKSVSIAGVKHFERFDGCYSCSGKVVPQSETSCSIGKCNCCGSIQCIDQCKSLTSARLDINTGTDVKAVVVFSPVLEDICQGTATVENLIYCEEFDAVVSEKDVIVSISRCLQYHLFISSRAICKVPFVYFILHY